MKHVLIIEDDELLREIYATKMDLEGFAVSTARDGLEGLELAGARRPNVILLDMIMPRMTGMEFLLKYQPIALHPDVAVVVMSNKSSVHEVNQARALGVLDYLIKSQHTPDDIVIRIRELLDRRATGQANA